MEALFIICCLAAIVVGAVFVAISLSMPDSRLLAKYLLATVVVYIGKLKKKCRPDDGSTSKEV